VQLFEAFGTFTSFLYLGLLLVMVFALVDALIRPTAAYVAAGKRTKLLWTLVLAVATAASLLFGVGSIFGIAGLIAAIVYIVDVRPAVRAAAGQGPTRGSSSGPYGPW
jgi:hypothetical protein